MNNEKTYFEKFVVWMSIVVAIILIFVLIIIKVNYPTFKLSFFILSIIGVFFFFGMIIFLSSYLGRKKKDKTENLNKEDEKIPKPVTLEQCREIAKKATINPEYAEYLQTCLGEKVESFGKGQKSLIYTYHGKGYYDDNNIFVVINMHYPNDRRTILIDPTPVELQMSKMLLAVSPEPSPDVREIRTSNPILGTEQTVIETVHKDEKKEEKKESDKGL